VRSARCPIVLAAALALAAGGCGDSATTPSPTATNPIASTPESSPPPPDATQPGTGPVTTTTPTPTTTDEQRVRVPATFTITATGIRPRTITVPPFLAIEIGALDADAHGHTLAIATDPPATLTVEAGKSASTRIRGQRAGRYPVEIDGHDAGTLVVGGEVGP
jgi:hypothetical protein